MDPKKLSSTKNSLIDDLRRLLIEGSVNTQEAICHTLTTFGHNVNQSKISRLLRKLGAAKSKNELGEIVYRLPLEPAPPTISGRLADLIIDVNANETTIVVYTSPGSAQLIARVLDYHKEKIAIMATIAGDDSIFIAPKSIHHIEKSIEEIRRLLSL